MGSQSGWSRVFSLYDQFDWNADGIPVRLESSFLIVWWIRLEWKWDRSQAGVKFSHCVMNKTGMEMGSQSGWSQVFSLYDELDWNGDSSYNEKTWLQPDWDPLFIPVLFIIQWENLTPAWLGSHFHSSLIHHTMRKLDSSLTAIPFPFQSYSSHNEKTWLQPDWDPICIPVKLIIQWENSTPAWLGSHLHSSLIHHTMTKLNSSLTGIPSPFESNWSYNEKTQLQPDWDPISIPV